jgi:dienelactone hydrolase
VLFAHGSGSGRLSPRNRAVARTLHEQGFATLLVDLLSEREQALDAESGRYRFDIALLASRLVAATDWIATQPRLRDLPIGYFGSSTGAAAALLAAAARPERVAAIVSRGGRVDLAGAAGHLVHAATLLIVGSEDETVLDLNERALAELRCKKQLLVVEGAGHLFEEPGALDVVTQLAARWFADHLRHATVEARV